MSTLRTKLGALALTAILIFGFAACGSTAVRQHTDSPSPSPSASAGAAALNYAAAYAKYDPDETAVTVNGTAIPWNEYFYWLQSIISNYTSSTGTAPDWSSMYDDSNTLQQAILNAVLENIESYTVLFTHAQAQSITLSAEDLQDLSDQWKSDVQSYASQNTSAAPTAGLTDDQIFAQQEQEFTSYLSSVYVQKPLYDKLGQARTLYQNMLTSMFGENASKISDDDAISWAEDQGYMAAKHILFLTIDSSGNALDDATIAQKKQDAEDTLATLKATPADQLETTFDQIMNDKSEDTGLSSYPDGYCFLSSDMQAAFSDAAAALQPGQMTTDLVETSYGYHIILRIPLTPDMVPVNQSTNLRQLAASSQFTSLLQSWEDESTVTFAPDFQNLDLAALFGTPGGADATPIPSETPTPSASASPVPSETPSPSVSATPGS